MRSVNQLLFFICAIAFLGPLSRGQKIQPCIVTNTSCPCAMRPSSGSCLRYQGDGKCLISECNDGYKCDCLAFEMCNRSECSKYTTLENVIPSETIPFSCHLTPNAGQCTGFNNFIDTLTGADYAKLESSQAVQALNADTLWVAGEVLSIQEDKVVVDAALEQLDIHANNVTEGEQVQIENSVMTVVNSLGESVQQITVFHNLMTEAYEANMKAGFYRRIAYRKEQAANDKETELSIETEKPSNELRCLICPTLQAQITQLLNERWLAIEQAGKWAQKARVAKQRGTSQRFEVERIRKQATEARLHVVNRASTILDRLRRMISYQ